MDYLMWAGKPSVADLGWEDGAFLSKRVSEFPVDLEPGRSRVFFVHDVMKRVVDFYREIRRGKRKGQRAAVYAKPERRPSVFGFMTIEERFASVPDELRGRLPDWLSMAARTRIAWRPSPPGQSKEIGVVGYRPAPPVELKLSGVFRRIEPMVDAAGVKRFLSFRIVSGARILDRRSSTSWAPTSEELDRRHLVARETDRGRQTQLFDVAPIVKKFVGDP